MSNNRSGFTHHTRILAARPPTLKSIAAFDVTRGLNIASKARAILAGTCAAETAVSIVDMLAASAGAVSIFETCELERAVRDARAAARHVAISPNNYLIGGRVALGLDPGTDKF